MMPNEPDALTPPDSDSGEPEQPTMPLEPPPNTAMFRVRTYRPGELAFSDPPPFPEQPGILRYATAADFFKAAAAAAREPNPETEMEAVVFCPQCPNPARGKILLKATMRELLRIACRKLKLNPRRIWVVVGLVAGRVPGSTQRVALDQEGTLLDAWLRMRDAMPPPAEWTGMLKFELAEQPGITLANGAVAENHAEMVKRLREHLAATFPELVPHGAR